MFSKFKINIIALKVLMALCLTFNVLADKNEAFMGNIDAKNVLIEYASLSCVHCANFHTKQLPSIKKDLIDTGKLKYIYKDFPLDKPAMIASMVSNCYKGEQYFTVLNTLFRNQKKWVVKSENLEVALHSTLKVHGITIEDIKDCTIENAINKEKWDSILEERLNAQEIGVNSTPSFFLNGKKLEGQVTSEILKDIIE